MHIETWQRSHHLHEVEHIHSGNRKLLESCLQPIFILGSYVLNALDNREKLWHYAKVERKREIGGS
jgi:hypothetical protein